MSKCITGTGENETGQYVSETTQLTNSDSLLAK